MALRIVRRDITQMKTQAIVNIESPQAKAGEVFITPGFDLPAEYIIHVVSPLNADGDGDEEEKLRDCYRNSLKLAKEHRIISVAIPLIATGSTDCPKEEGMRIAVDEISAFLIANEMQVFLVVYDEKAAAPGGKPDPNLEAYIDSHFVEERKREENGIMPAMSSERLTGAGAVFGAPMAAQSMASQPMGASMQAAPMRAEKVPGAGMAFGAPEKKASVKASRLPDLGSIFKPKSSAKQSAARETAAMPEEAMPLDEPFMAFDKIGVGCKEPGAGIEDTAILSGSDDVDFVGNASYIGAADMDLEESAAVMEDSIEVDFDEEHESRLEERMQHISDTFSEYLLYLIQVKKMENAEVYKRAIVDKKTFSKIKNHPDYHPQKLTALCLCVGAKLKLDETKDLLARAGYALSPCDKMDIIFSYFIENEIYDMIELDIQLEEHGLDCIIS